MALLIAALACRYDWVQKYAKSNKYHLPQCYDQQACEIYKDLATSSGISRKGSIQYIYVKIQVTEPSTALQNAKEIADVLIYFGSNKVPPVLCYTMMMVQSINLITYWLTLHWSHKDSIESKNFYKFCKSIESWCQHQKYSFLFIEYDCEENLLKLNFNVEKLKTDFKIRESNDPNNRILLYLVEKQIILNYIDSSSCIRDSMFAHEAKQR